MTAAGSGLGWPDRDSGLVAGSGERGVGWPLVGLGTSADAGTVSNRVGVRSASSAGSGVGEVRWDSRTGGADSGVWKFLVRDDPWRPEFRENYRAEGAAAMPGTRRVSEGLGWPVVTDMAVGMGAAARGLGWPTPRRKRRLRVSARGVMSVSRETEHPVGREPFARPGSEVAAPADEAGGSHDRTRGAAGAPPSSEESGAAAGPDETATSGQYGWAFLEGEDSSLPRPHYRTSARLPQRGSAESRGERQKFDSGDNRAESPASIRPFERSVSDGPQSHVHEGPMIASTYSGAPRAQDESEDEVVVPVAPDASADTPIARAVQAAMKARATSKPWPRPGACRILTIANQKGGVGKTTTAVNMAASLAMHGSRVLVVDLDPQGNASTALDVEHRSGTSSIYNVLVDGLALADVIKPVDGFPLLHCAPATIDLAGAEIELVPLVARESRLARAVSAYDASNLDYIFIDCPPSLGLLTVNALVAAPEVLIPIQCEYYALEGLEQLLRTVDLVRSHLNPNLGVSTILLTMFDSRTRLASQVAEEVRSHFGGLVLQSVIPRSVRVSEAPSYGQSVMTYDPGSSGALAYLEAARELAHASSPAATS